MPDGLNDAPLSDKVLAIETAQPRDGGTGALYVLLKRRRADSDRKGARPAPR